MLKTRSTHLLIATLSLTGCAAPDDQNAARDPSVETDTEASDERGAAGAEDQDDAVLRAERPASIEDWLKRWEDLLKEWRERANGGGTTTPPPSNPPPSTGGEDPPPSTGGGTTPGNGGVVNATIVVKKGQTFDGGGKRYTAGSALGDGSQEEGQKPVFKLEDGAKIRNVVLGAPAADGIHTYGTVELSNITWEDIGEDALTIKESGTVVLNGGSAKNGSDKVFQINAASTFRVSNFKADTAGKFIRQNGGTTFKVDVFIDRCDIANMKESIFRTDSKTSTVTMTNSRYHNIGKELFMGVSAGNIKQSSNTKY